MSREVSAAEQGVARGPAVATQSWVRLAPGLLLGALLLLALALRLLVWRWREFYPLGGDEQEYFNQALTLLREWRYTELRLMRPPLYGVFLAGCIVLFDSLVQHLRLVQACISAATLLPLWLLTQEIRDWRNGREAAAAQLQSPIVRYRAPALAALLCALSYTLAVNATELLTETLFLFGLNTLFWLLLRAARLSREHHELVPVHDAQPSGLRRFWPIRSPALTAGLAGLVLGALCLTRSVALPLLPLGALWLLLAQGKALGAKSKARALAPVLLFTLAFCLLVLPWTTRNYLSYGALILIDTTGPENLWLDNDPAGREAVKAQLYALGSDMAARQRLATQQGSAVILADPQRFVAKAWGELLKFFALEYSDDMRARPSIWLPPAEVAARLVLGDGLWLLLLLLGSYGIAALSTRPAGSAQSLPSRVLLICRDPRWLFVPWALYVLLTGLIFHVELRYRLPLYPVLLPFAALVLSEGRTNLAPRRWRVLALLLPLICLLLTLLHRPYPLLAWQLGWKHWHLAQAEARLAQGDVSGAEAAAQAALVLDERSALARVALARTALRNGDDLAATELLRAAIAAIPAHPHAHLLLGDWLRQQGDLEAARRELSYETGSLEDLQAWSWQRFTTPPPARLEVGAGLDLGFVQGFHSAEAEGWRWTRDRAQLRLSVPQQPQALQLRLAAGRPTGAPDPQLELFVAGRSLGRLAISNDWRDYRLPLPSDPELWQPGSVIVLELRSTTFVPRDYAPTSPDARALGVMVAQVAIVATDT